MQKKFEDSIAGMSPERRLESAREKMGGDNGADIVASLTSHIRTHENNRWLFYDQSVSQKVPASYARTAFETLRHDSIHYELIRE